MESRPTGSHRGGRLVGQRRPTGNGGPITAHPTQQPLSFPPLDPAVFQTPPPPRAISQSRGRIALPHHHPSPPVAQALLLAASRLVGTLFCLAPQRTPRPNEILRNKPNFRANPNQTVSDASLKTTPRDASQNLANHMQHTETEELTKLHQNPNASALLRHTAGAGLPYALLPATGQVEPLPHT
jgi:hypothetical protein